MSRTAATPEESIIDRSMLPPYLKPDERDMIEVAVLLGWDYRPNKQKTITLVSHDGHKTLRISASNRNVDVKRMKRDIVRHGRPDKIALADSILDASDPTLRGIAAALMRDIHKAEVVEKIVEEKPELPEEPTEPTESVASDEPRILSEKPMIAKASQGWAYESKATIERLWSDGRTDYACSRCDFVTDKRLGVRSHFSMHRAGDEARADSVVFKADVPEAVSYAPRDSRVTALADVIREATKAGHKTPFAIARTALTWVHEQSHLGTEHAVETEPLEPDEIVNRIRRLLDDGSMSHATARVRDLEERLLASEAEARKARAQAEQARSTLTALVDLAAEAAASKGEGDE